MDAKTPKKAPTLPRQALLRLGQSLRRHYEFALDDPLPAEMQLQLLRMKAAE